MAAGDVVSIACNQVIRSSPKDGTCSGGVVITDGAMVSDGTGLITISPPVAKSVSIWISGKQQITNSKAFLGFTQEDFLIYMDTSNRIGTVDSGNRVLETLTLDTWYNVIIINNGTNNLFYVNNVLKYTGTSRDMTITKILDRNTGSRVVIGSATNLQIFNRALTQAEITQIYEAGKDAYSPVTDGLVAQYSGRDYYGTAAAPTTILDTASNNNSTALFVERALKTQRVNANSKYIVEALDGKAILVNSIEEAA
jgi:hypothetical protein